MATERPVQGPATVGQAKCAPKLEDPHHNMIPRDFSEKRLAIAAFHDTLGAFFMAHPPIMTFDVDVTDPSHRLTQGAISVTFSFISLHSPAFSPCVFPKPFFFGLISVSQNGGAGIPAQFTVDDELYLIELQVLLI